MASVYPASLDDNDTLYVAVNGITAKLANDHDSNIQTITVDSTAGAPSSGYATIVGEAIHYTAKTSTTLTGVTRHTDGTQAASHKQNDKVKFGLVAAHHNSLVQAVFALEAKLGTGTTIDAALLKANTIVGTKFADADLSLPAGRRRLPVKPAAGFPVITSAHANISGGAGGVSFAAGSNDEVGQFTLTLSGTIAFGQRLFTLTYRNPYPNGSVFWAGNVQGHADIYLTGIGASTTACDVYIGLAAGAAAYTFGYIIRGW